MTTRQRASRRANLFALARLPFGLAAGPERPGRRRCLARALASFFLRRGAGGAGAQSGGASGARGARAPVWPAGRNSARAPAPQGHSSTFRGACASAQAARGRSRPALHSVLPAASRGARSRAPPRGGRRELAPTVGPEASAPTNRSRCALRGRRARGGRALPRPAGARAWPRPAGERPLQRTEWPRQAVSWAQGVYTQDLKCLSRTRSSPFPPPPTRIPSP